VAACRVSKQYTTVKGMIDYYKTKSQPITRVMVIAASVNTNIFMWFINMKSRMQGDFPVLFCGEGEIPWPHPIYRQW